MKHSLLLTILTRLAAITLALFSIPAGPLAFAADDESNLTLLDTQNPAIRDLAAARSADIKPQSIPLSELGAKASADYKGDAIGIERTVDGAQLRTGFQKLAGTVSRTGLVIESTEADGGRLSLVADALGRDEGVHHRLPRTGAVEVHGGTVVFERPGLVEEYSVSADGVRQDFIVLKRPGGEGELTVELILRGARAEAMSSGVKLVLNGSGRELAYSRLKVTDVTGRELTAHLEVLDSDRLAVSVEDENAAYPVRIDPTFSDVDWVSLNPSIPGTNGGISAFVVDSSGNLYAGGSFSVIGTVAANSIAKWNGNTWSALGSGVDSIVNALALDSSGNLYAGGYFTTAGGVTAHGIAKWNGSAWSALGSGIYRVNAIAVDRSGNLYAGGEFTWAGGLPANYVAKWNGSAWSALGTGVGFTVRALAVDGSGNLYAGGDFGIAKWNGSEWSALGAGVNGIVRVLALDGSGNLYVGSTARTASGVLATSYIAKWNGSAWSVLGSGMTSGTNYTTVYSLVVDGNGYIYAGGDFISAGGESANRIAKWNGSTWSALDAGMEGTNYPGVHALVLDGSGNLYAGGGFTKAGGVTALSIAKWNGSAWLALCSGINDRIRALAVDGSGNLYAGGNFITAGGVTANCIAKWNGSEWSALGSGMSYSFDNPEVDALAVDGSGNLYAGGQFTTAGGVTANCIAKWNGNAWTALGSGVSFQGHVARIYALAVDGSGNLYAGGVFSTAGGVSASAIAKWNGSTWSALGSWFLYSSVHAIALDGSGNVYAAGDFTTAGGVPANSIAKWNGSVWSALGSGVTTGYRVYALAVDGSGNLYAGGKFTTVGGMSANNIAKWNGSGWSTLDAGVPGFAVYALTVDGGGNLYAGGDFTTAGGVSAKYITKWDGSAWSALGSGMDNTVNALAVDTSGHLFVGGEFDFVGATVSPYIAQANIGPATATITNVRAAQIPGTHQVRITYDLDASGPCTVGVHALLDNPGMSLVLPPSALEGDVTGTSGNKVSPGTGKSITLTVAETTAAGTTVKVPDLHNLFTKSLKFKVIATL